MTPKTFRRSAKAGLIRDLKSFIRQNTSPERGTEAMALAVGGMLKRSGFRAVYQRIRRGNRRWTNVLGIKGGRGRPLLLCSHMDTVPGGDGRKWTRTRGNPWQPTVHSGRIYGLGSADDKGPLLSMIRAVRECDEHMMKRPLVIAATFGEESGMAGARLLVRRWPFPKPFLAIVGEPTSLDVTYRHKGIGVIVLKLQSRYRMGSSSRGRRLQMTFRGRAAHSGRPWLGVNALSKAMRRLECDPRSSDISMERLEGGESPNVIPDHASVIFFRIPHGISAVSGHGPALFPLPALVSCLKALEKVLEPLKRKRDRSFHPATLTSSLTLARTRKNVLELYFDLRLLPGQSVRSITRPYDEKLRRIMHHHRGLKAHIRVERDNPPLDLRRHAPEVQGFYRLLREFRPHARLVTKPSCTEAGIYHAWGVPSMVIGPGVAQGNIHAPNESIALSDIAKGVSFYRFIVERCCGRRKDVSHS